MCAAPVEIIGAFQVTQMGAGEGHCMLGFCIGVTVGLGFSKEGFIIINLGVWGELWTVFHGIYTYPFLDGFCQLDVCITVKATTA